STNHTKISLIRALYYSYLILGVFRLLFASVSLYSMQMNDILKYDVVMTIGIKIGIINYMVALCWAPMPMCALFLDHFIHVKRYNYIWHLSRQLIVCNPIGTIKGIFGISEMCLFWFPPEEEIKFDYKERICFIVGCLGNVSFKFVYEV